ncbi:MAG: acylphosphatase [Bacteroidales bacterium]|nr:acylphosphatase [Bacteroidales bacterium]
MKVHYSIQIFGRVQNVGFRYFVVTKAGEYQINGTVKNEADGTVVVEAEGAKEQLDIFLADLENGPGWARIDDVKVSQPPVADYNRFRVVY